MSMPAPCITKIFDTLFLHNLLTHYISNADIHALTIESVLIPYSLYKSALLPDCPQSETPKEKVLLPIAAPIHDKE